MPIDIWFLALQRKFLPLRSFFSSSWLSVKRTKSGGRSFSSWPEFLMWNGVSFIFQFSWWTPIPILLRSQIREEPWSSHPPINQGFNAYQWRDCVLGVNWEKVWFTKNIFSTSWSETGWTGKKAEPKHPEFRKNKNANPTLAFFFTLLSDPTKQTVSLEK